MQDKIIGMSGNITVHLSDRGEYVIDIDTTYGGQTSLSTLGTVTIGNWHAAIINPTFGGTGVDNGEFTISLGGSFRTTGAITLESKEGSRVSLPNEGMLVNRSEALDPLQNLKDVANISQAYDNLAPVAAKGDIVVFDGATNWPLPLGEYGQWLAATPTTSLGMQWKELPSSYSYIMNRSGLTMPSRKKLRFEGYGFEIRDDEVIEDSTAIKLSSNLQDLAALSTIGFLVRNSSPINAYQTIETRYLLPGNGIHIANPEGYDNPIISISPFYKGQPSIEEVGHIKHGYWGGTIVDPEFGGTGVNNKHPIALGGALHTTAPFSIMQMQEYKPSAKLKGFYVEQNSVTLVADGTTEVHLPKSGMLATVEESLQTRHNLGDLDNKLQAFSNISPTKKRGDLIVRGYGDYDTVVSIGAPSQVLTVVEDEDTLVEWTFPITLDDVEECIEEYVSNTLVDIREAMEEEPRLLGDMPLETVLEAILMQFDYMKTAGTLPVIKELRTVLDQWTKSKHKKV